MDQENSSQTILVTGAAGFIGFHLCKILLQNNFKVIGLDNLNDYYPVQLKYDRLKELGVLHPEQVEYKQSSSSKNHKNFLFVRLNLEDKNALPQLFEQHQFDKVINLAAQAGVRNSLKNPFKYIDSNIVGFLNLLECMRHYRVKKLIFASSSSVYGNNSKIPFAESDQVDEPLSLYAATKKSNELLAFTYSHLFEIQTIGLRFFTVYGPWGRPDMAIFLFPQAILKNQPVKVFNHGNLCRDFTFIDDIINGMMKIIQSDFLKKKYEIYNIGNSKPVELLDFIEAIEKKLGKKAKKEMLPMQPGDVRSTWANITRLQEDFDYQPQTDLQEGVNQFLNWLEVYSKQKVDKPF